MSNHTRVVILDNLILVPWPQAFALCFLWSVLAVRLTVHAARRYGVLAHPSQRASHTVPTPRLGGVGFVSSFFIVLFLLEQVRPVPVAPWVGALIVGGGYALVGGLLDDLLDLNPRWKFLFQAAAAGTAVASGLRLDVFDWPGGAATQFSSALGIILAFLFVVFMMNAYNFMDGMDGQAAIFGIFAFAGMLAPLVGPQISYFSGEALVCAMLAGGLAGFLPFNAPGCDPERKTFMGDSGSQFIGFALAVVALRLQDAAPDRFPLAAALILFSPFIYDVLFTLVRRFVRGENLLVAHRSHLYQRLMIAGWSHGRTLALNGLLYAACFFLSHVYAVGLPAVGGLSRNPAVWEWAAVGATACALAAYTALVLAVERRAAA